MYIKIEKQNCHPFADSLPQSLSAAGRLSVSPAAHYCRVLVLAEPQLLLGVPCHLSHTEFLSLLAVISTLLLKPSDQKVC